MSDFYENYLRLCNAAGKSPSAVALECGLSKAAVNGWKNGRSKPSDATLIKLAEYFGVSVEELTTKNALAQIKSERIGFIRIPVLGSIPAGIPMEAIQDIIDYEDISEDWLSGGREYFALKVTGDSMWPEYLPGDTVIVQKQSTCVSGDDCVVYVNGYDATLKTVRMNDADHSLTLVPINNQYPPKTFTAQEIAELPVTIAGIVVELRRNKRK